MNVRRMIAALLIAAVEWLGSVCLAQSEFTLEPAQRVVIGTGSIFTGEYAAAVNLFGVLSSGKAIKLYQGPTLQEKTSNTNLPMRMTAMTFASSGTQAVLGGTDGNVYLFDVSTGDLKPPISIHSGAIIGLHQTSFALYSAGTDRTVKATDLASGSSIKSWSPSDHEISAFKAAASEKVFAVGLSNGEIDLLNEQLVLLKTFSNNQSDVTAMAFTSDDKFLAAGTSNGKIFIWDVQSGQLKTTINQSAPVKSISFDPQTQWLMSATTDSVLTVFDAATFTMRKQIHETDGSFSYITFMNSDFILTGTNNGIVESWKLVKVLPDTTNPVVMMQQPAEPSLKLYAMSYEIRGWVFDDSDIKSVVVNGAPAAIAAHPTTDTIHLPAGMKVAKQFSAVVPLDSIGRNTVTVRVEDSYQHTTMWQGIIERLSDNEAVEIISPPNNADVDVVSIPIKFRTWFDVASFSISNNMMEIVSGQTSGGKLSGDVLTEDIPLVSGYNQIQVSITGKNGRVFTKSLGLNRKAVINKSVVPAALAGVKRDKGNGPQRWAVVVGVSEYQNAGIPSLKFADRDADAFANFLRTPEGGGYDTDHLRVLLNKDATLANIKDALINFLGQAIDIDLVMIYFAGHGAPEPARQQNMYLLTYDSDPNQLGTTAFPMWDIQTVLARHINAKRVVVFTDACHSGNISTNFTTRGLGVTENNLINQYLTDLSRTKEGIVVFTASAAGEVSQEIPEFGHGVFTYYLLEGLQGKADYNNDYTVTINEVMQYVEEQVKRKTRGAQNPTRSQTDYDKEMTVSTISHYRKEYSMRYIFLIVFFSIIFCLGYFTVQPTPASAATTMLQNDEGNIGFQWAFGAMIGKEKKFVPILRDTVLKSGEEIKMMVHLTKECYVYLFYSGANKELQLLFPGSLRQFQSDYAVGKNYYIPLGRNWMVLDHHQGKETFFLLASNVRLLKIEAKYGDYLAADASKKPALAESLITEIRTTRKQYTTFATLAEKPIIIGGNIRGTEKTEEKRRYDVADIANQILAQNFYSKTITIDHQ